MSSLLFEPLKIGEMEIKNRVVMPGLTSNFASKTGEVTEQLIAYLAERAKGGIGLVLVESAITHWTGRGGPFQLGIHNDNMIPGLTHLTETLHRHGVRVGIQIMHGGRQMTGEFSGEQPIAPTAIACPVVGVVPRALTVPEIEGHVENFAFAAERAAKSGFDCIEFVASHGYLISNFLSSFSNKRTDLYGVNFEGRFRFLKNIIIQTKQRIGDKFPLIVRINAEEYVEDGIDIEDAKRIAVELEKLGVHCIDVSVSVKASYHHLSASAGEPMANQAHLAGQIKKAVRIPVITAGRILDLETAEEVLNRGQADLVAIGRGVIADPHIVNKIRNGIGREVLPCIGCNACNQRSRRPQIVCVVNSNTGRESSMEMIQSISPKRIAILGGGLAALETARIAAQRSHKVTVFPNGPLGGLTYYRSRVPGMSEFKKAIDYFNFSLHKHQVEIVSLYRDCPDVEQDGYDVVLDTQWRPESDSKQGVLAIDVLRDAQVGHSVVMDGDGLLACEVALYLAHQGRIVKVISNQPQRPIRDAHPTVSFFLLNRLAKIGVEFLAPHEIGSFDTLVVPHGFQSDGLIGDAYESSDLAERVYKAGEIGREI